ncbi:MAG: TetR/AcrR family transcriptional regulator [Cyanomargarita calcarea GSE-NOS-MK-12-04C]|jgi:AcrR family transcriptional regulator|uniref:TetR/AcrR family transcriptional regulator n=1 Tax=Cyanomargarita calcarea GSE-NOS-MK-12-04C TaxID=2839659 RepID=A0A951QQG6_9CYAN|nr:TetR/AcrR family transcriptional regulator [Cyanomargarita calcarea GSE-NOS-MK-12-04C]
MVRIRANEVSKEIASDKVEQILSGAMQEFLKHGFAGTSMDRVAQAAGVSKATVYNHFQDKEGLFKTLIEQLAQEKFQSAFGRQPLQGEPRIVLRQLIASALQGMICDEQHQAFVRVLIGESGRFPELAQTWVQHIMKPTIAILCKYMTDHPELDIPDPEATARIMIGALVHFMMTQEMLHGKEIIPMESDRMIDALTHLMLRGAQL